MSRSAACAQAVVAELAAQGVTDVVLCPGSRSAPLALALYEADAAGQLRLHVRIDERTAGFLALGLAKGSGRPAVVVTTSGTAVGNLLPAVMEAHHSRVPLLALTADRPAAMVGTGANQTTDQREIFGVFTCTAQSLDADCDPELWTQATAWALSRGGCGLPGPAHLNLALPEPLVPDEAEGGGALFPPQEAASPDAAEGERAAEMEIDAACPRLGRQRVTGFLSPSPRLQGGLFGGIRTTIAGRRQLAGSGLAGESALIPLGAETRAPTCGVVALEPGLRTVVVCGDASPLEGARAREFAEAAQLPLLAEPSSGARSGRNALRCGRLLLGTALGAQVERVVMFGHPTLSRPVTGLLTRTGVELIVVGTGPELPNPGWNAAQTVEAVSLEPSDAEWLDAWLAADAACGQRVDVLLAGLDYTSGPAVAAAVLAGVGQGTLMLGNSMAIRDADLAPVAACPGQVFANRGLSGIDGTVSTAAGMALATGDPVTLLCGDLTFVHDANALAIGPGEPRPDLRVVVADDAGGSIFATLEYGQPRFAAGFERVFATSTGIEPVALATGYGIPARQLEGLDELVGALAKPVRGLEVLVIGVDRARRSELAGALAGCAPADTSAG